MYKKFILFVDIQDSYTYNENIKYKNLIQEVNE
ncbi:hypothetical protein BB65665_08677 [Bacillus sp. 916]|nr:hypothetical protein BB65665_08677 [Bacillus sp. 916]